MFDTKSSGIVLPWLLLAAAFIVYGAYFTADRMADHLTRQSVAVAMTGGDAMRAPSLLRKYGCSGCHTIPGVPGADGQVGGPLAGLASRVYIGGVLTNSPDHLVAWIVSPDRFSSNTAMPVTGVTEAEARDVAAYLYQH